jgi:superfamily II DNA or RNA helicase
MMKVVTKYTLGLSGTMVRKDGLTKVFKHFLGDVVHKEKNDTTSHAVIVKGIQYKVDDAEFNETEYDYRGNPKFSTMISKVCNYNRRSEFILDVLQNELATNPDQQVMILAHNRSLLEYFHDAIEHRKIATVGYYVGGMKEAALKLSESKKVIIATYAMASEGLDIKTLTTLIMASPKTDVCQSVGRILRVKHAAPLVIDIIDPQDVFRSQWLKRQTYYIKQKYRIIMTDTEGYYKNNWVVKYNPPSKAVAIAAAATTSSREAELADADIIEIDEKTGNLSVTTEQSAKNKMKSTIPKTNGKCLIRLEE